MYNQQQQLNSNINGFPGNNIQIQSAYSYNPSINSPVPPQMSSRMSLNNFNNQGCPSPMMSHMMNSYNPQNMFFTDSMMTSPGSFSSFFNLSDASGNDNIDDVLNFDPTPRKRSFNLIQNPQTDQVQNSGKKMHIEEVRNMKNENYQRSVNIGYVKVTSLKKVFSCFIGGCQLKTFSCQQFVQHLSFFHGDQRDVLRGFCMICENFDCGCSIYNNFVHLYGHSGDQVRGSQQPQQTPSVNNGDYIKKEVECEIIDVDDENVDESEARSTPEVEDETRCTTSPTFSHFSNQMSLEVTQIIPMEPPVDLKEDNSDKTIQIKQEAVPAVVIENLEATVRIPEPEQQEQTQIENSEENSLLVPIDPVFKLPSKGPKIPTYKKPTRTLRKRAMSTFVESDNASLQKINKKQKSQTTEDISSSEQLSETMCIDFISKKINDAKANDKFKNFKPNESMFKLVDVTSVNIDDNEEESRNATKIRREAQDDKLKTKFTGFNEKRKEFNARRESLRPRKSVEKEKEAQSDDIFFSNITIDNLLERIKNAAKSKRSSINVDDMPQKSKQKSTIDEYFQKPDMRNEENLNDDLMLPNREEKTPQKSESNKKNNNSGKENEERVEKLRNGSENDEKTSKVPEKSRNSVESSSNKSATSINSSSNALELSKHVPYTVDIEALIAKASSSFEFGSIKELYPWIDENITSAIFKTKTSIDILLNEFSLFSTYKCMNELCYFFTTDLEDFKKHARSHDSYNNYCSYCLKNFEKSNDLCNHLDITHKFDRFQCSKCMFRSCQKGYVDVHQRIHHADVENCEVFKSPVQKLLKCDRSKCLPALQKNREKLVMPYKCKSKFYKIFHHITSNSNQKNSHFFTAPKCKEVFFSKDNFRKHLEMESNKPSCQEFVTLICRQLYSIDHSKTSNNTEGIYQCLHCKFGTDNSDIFDHMALNHPHEFAYICKRVKPQKLVELNIVSPRETVENSTSIEYIGTTTTEAKSFEQNLQKLNSKNLEKEAKNCMGKKQLVVDEVVTLDD